MKPNNLLKTLGVFLAGCLVALAVLEVLLRVYNPLEIRFRPDRIVLPVNKQIYLQQHRQIYQAAPRLSTRRIAWVSGAPRLPGISRTT